ncbi:MAG: hypothetical protein MSA90_18020 [Faecalicatena sp.]|uniref:hypothetical protein n=1 Tax=Faecalicatena sp. TaxID=2005360 RepID=UPI00258491E8|nr:hypothetical protein [Faecalicatena sp.]MCI6467347.1 hypothetical protein [Faecalicatena sp.]MDY5620353.1 hypothetical protein [Lachnospiraceae bacterium]
MNTKALLVVDVEEDYIQKYEEGLLKRINQRIKRALSDGELIIYMVNIKILRLEEKKSPLANGLYTASNHVFSKKKASAFSNIELVNCDCAGALNSQRFEKTKETLGRLGIEV